MRLPIAKKNKKESILPNLTFVPQGGWGLIDNSEGATGVYTDGMSACSGLAIVSDDGKRGAFCHYDCQISRLLDIVSLLRWLSDTDQITGQTYNVYFNLPEIIGDLQNEVGDDTVTFNLTEVVGQDSGGLYLVGGVRYLSAEDLETDEFTQLDAPIDWNNADFPSANTILTLDPQDWRSGGAVTSVLGQTNSVYQIFDQVKQGILDTEE